MNVPRAWCVVRRDEVPGEDSRARMMRTVYDRRLPGHQGITLPLQRTDVNISVRIGHPVKVPVATPAA